MTTPTLLAVLLVLIVGVPVWPWSRDFGWYPVGIAGLALVILELLILLRW
jgi:hypothetical protein